MRYRQPWLHIRIAIFAFVTLASVNGLLAQNRSGSLRGQVTDASGGAVANAAVQVITPTGQVLARTTDGNGAFEANDLPPGDYRLEVTVQGFAPYTQALQIIAGQMQQLTGLAGGLNIPGLNIPGLTG